MQYQIFFVSVCKIKVRARLGFWCRLGPLFQLLAERPQVNFDAAVHIQSTQIRCLNDFVFRKLGTRALPEAGEIRPCSFATLFRLWREQSPRGARCRSENSITSRRPTALMLAEASFNPRHLARLNRARRYCTGEYGRASLEQPNWPRYRMRRI